MVQQLAVSVGQCSERGRKARNQDFHGAVMPAGSALSLKGRFAHVFHIGDSRISRVADETLEPLTSDHRVVISSAESYLGRALGMAESVERPEQPDALEAFSKTVWVGASRINPSSCA